MANLEVTVVGAVGLSDRETLTRQDPYVVLEYGNQRYRSKTDIDGGTSPAFNANFSFTLQPGVGDLGIVIWNENVLRDNVIGSCRIPLQRVQATGMEDSYFPVYSNRQQQRGSLRVILKCRQTMNASPYSSSPFPQPSYSAPASAYPAPYPPQTYLPPPSAYPSHQHPSQQPYAAAPPAAYSSPPAAYPPTSYPPGSYPPSSYPPSPYPPSSYPPGAPPAYPPSYPPSQRCPPAYLGGVYPQY